MNIFLLIFYNCGYFPLEFHVARKTRSRSHEIIGWRSINQLLWIHYDMLCNQSISTSTFEYSQVDAAEGKANEVSCQTSQFCTDSLVPVRRKLILICLRRVFLDVTWQLLPNRTCRNGSRDPLMTRASAGGGIFFGEGALVKNLATVYTDL